MRWLIDGNNVMGAAADGWWNDPPAAAERLARQVARWSEELAETDPGPEVVLVFDGRPVAAVAEQAGGSLRVEFAPTPKRDAADDLIVELAEKLFVDPDLTVVTSDKGLVARLPPGVEVVAAGRFRREHLRLGR
ncbi:MAG: NYN domain-containing protein [Microthrixaceae bacterium]